MQTQQGGVLVIDGDWEVRETLQVILEDEGYEVQTAPDYAACLEMLRTSRRPLVVLLDVVPLATLTRGQSGLGLLELVEQGAERLGRHAYVVLTTNPDAVAVQAGAILAHLAVPVLSKPFDLNRLLGTIAYEAHALQLGTIDVLCATAS